MLAKPLENMTRLLKYAKIAHGTNMGKQLGKRNNNDEEHKMFVALSCQQAKFVNNLGMEIKQR